MARRAKRKRRGDSCQSPSPKLKKNDTGHNELREKDHSFSGLVSPSGLDSGRHQGGCSEPSHFGMSLTRKEKVKNSNEFATGAGQKAGR